MTKNATFSFDEDSLEQARLMAVDEGTTLNEKVREWVGQYASQRSNVARFDELMCRLKPMRAGRHFTREEMNER